MFLITNIFRDQLDRFGELYSMAQDAGGRHRGAARVTPRVILNGDDPAGGQPRPGSPARRMYYGIRTTAPTAEGARRCAGMQVPEHAADAIRCVRCQHALTYRVVHLSHLGDYRVRASAGTAGRPWTSRSPRSGVARRGQRGHRRDASGNLAAARAPAGHAQRVQRGRRARRRVRAAGSLEPASARRALARLRPAFGRLEEITRDGRQAVLSFVKNPTSYNATLRLILQRPGRKHVLAAHSNTVVDGEDFAWLWDVDLEQLVPHLASLVVSGTRAEEVALRMKYAGVGR